MTELEPLVRESLSSLLRELLDGVPQGAACYVLNAGDKGIVRSLDALSAEEASERPPGRSSVAAHVDHLAYGFELMHRWFAGENPWADANPAANWDRQTVTETQWQALRQRLDDEARTWLKALDHPRQWDSQMLTGAIAVAAHLAYHVGAIRQLSQAIIGPKA